MLWCEESRQKEEARAGHGESSRGRKGLNKTGRGKDETGVGVVDSGGGRDRLLLAGLFLVSLLTEHLGT